MKPYRISLTQTHRRALAAGSTLILTLALAGVLATTSEAGGGCTKTGTSQRDRMYGTDGHDVLCLLGGRDYGNARAANDLIKGGPGSDTIVGGPGADGLHGLDGNDELFATDGATNDTLDGGPGSDNCYGDQGDTFLSSCEHIVRV